MFGFEDVSVHATTLILYGLLPRLVFSFVSSKREREARAVLDRPDRIELLRLVDAADCRSEEHTSELQSLMRISYAVFCLTKTITLNNVERAHHTDTNNNT